MDKPKITPKDFFMWAGAMLALWAGVVAFIALIFDYINYTFPNALEQYVANPYNGSMPYEMAALIVLTPLFLVLMRVIRRDIARDSSRGEVWIRRWALFLTVFVAGATIVIDLITLITTFLSGEDLSVRFLLKVLVVLLVAGAGFMHFLADIWGFWFKFPDRARAINWGVGVLIVLTLGAGFVIVGTPQQARQMRIDSQRISDLQNIQSQIVYYWQKKEALPASLSDLNDPLSYWQMPLDPQTNEPYTYTQQGAMSFALCANFSQSGDSTLGYAVSVSPGGVSASADNWSHGAGEVCFNRSIDPQLYPPINKIAK